MGVVEQANTETIQTRMKKNLLTIGSFAKKGLLSTEYYNLLTEVIHFLSHGYISQKINYNKGLFFSGGASNTLKNKINAVAKNGSLPGRIALFLQKGGWSYTILCAPKHVA
jgi:hypothetical protein